MSIKNQIRHFKEVFDLIEHFKEQCDSTTQNEDANTQDAVLKQFRIAGSDDQSADVQQQHFSEKTQSALVMPLSHLGAQGNVWILKPTGFNRGKGIHVVNSLARLKSLLKEYSGHAINLNQAS